MPDIGRQQDATLHCLLERIKDPMVCVSRGHEGGVIYNIMNLSKAEYSLLVSIVKLRLIK